jgi:hypothetical protein
LPEVGAVFNRNYAWNSASVAVKNRSHHLRLPLAETRPTHLQIFAKVVIMSTAPNQQTA